MRRQFDQQLALLNRELIEMGALCEEVIALASKALTEGDPTLAAGEVVELAGWGGWNGRYIIKQAQHTVGTGGYKTKITLRRCLGY